MRTPFRWMAAAAAVFSPILGTTTAASEHLRFVYDDHGGRPGGTLKNVTFKAGDPRFRVEPPGKCGEPFLGGTAFGHPDPRLTDPKAVCGHGIVTVVHEPNRGRRPLLILPASTTQVASEEGMGNAAPSSVALDPVRLIRDHLPRLDAASGDAVAVVVELRNAIRSRDVVNAMRNVPKPLPVERRAD